MILTRSLQILGLLYPISELALIVVTRARRRGGAARDRGSWAIIWGAIAVGIFAGIALQHISAGRIPVPISWLHGIALVLLAGGIALRWVAILTLGRFFTTDVTIQSDHRIVRSGLYRRVRHPSYSGALLAFLGMAIAFGNWLSFIAILVPILAAFINRIRVEEASMVDALGEEYIEYRKTTRCLIPGVF
jgi:protein-S-isoprenylcysteine O-methyltransferase Ste14